MKQTLFKSSLIILAGLILSVPAFAETKSVKVSGSLDLYAFYRSNIDLLDNNDAGAVDVNGTVPSQSHSGSTTDRSEADEFFMSITQVQVDAELTDNVSTVVNLVNQRDWNANNFTSGAANTANEFDVLLDLSYVTLKEIFYQPLTLTIGRQDISLGRGFVLGCNPQNTSNTIEAFDYSALQSFDAIRATLDFAPWTIDFIYSKVTEGSLNPEDDIDIWATNVNYAFSEYNAVAEAYYVGIIDRNVLVSSGADTGDTDDNDTHTLGGRVQFDPISQITLGGELAYQFGTYRQNADAQGRDRDAWGADVFAEYRWDGNWKPMVGIEYVYLSGESDLSSTSTADYGSWNSTFKSTIYGLIHDDIEAYYATAQANDPVAGQNQQSINLYASLSPMEDLKLTASYYYFWTAEDVHATSTDPTTPTVSDSIGHEIDLTATYNYTEDVTFGMSAAWFVPGDLYEAPNDATATELISSVSVTY